MQVQKSKKKCVQKGYIWNPAKFACENDRYAESTIDDSMILCDEVFKSITTNFNEKKVICNLKNVYLLLTFLLITMILIIAVTFP